MGARPMKFRHKGSTRQSIINDTGNRRKRQCKMRLTI